MTMNARIRLKNGVATVPSVLMLSTRVYRGGLPSVDRARTGHSDARAARRAPRARAVGALGVALIALGLALEGAAVAQPSAPPVSAICQLAFEAATLAGEASPEPSLGASTVPSDPSPVPSPDASASPVAS